MIYTDYIRKYCMESPSILSKEDLKVFDKLVYKDNGKTLKYLWENPYNTVLIFDKGFVIFKLFELDIEKSIACELSVLYKIKGSKADKYWKRIIKEFWNFLKVNKCKKVIMWTKLNPDFWSKNYGFELKKYEMELEL